MLENKQAFQTKRERLQREWSCDPKENKNTKTTTHRHTQQTAAKDCNQRKETGAGVLRKARVWSLEGEQTQQSPVGTLIEHSSVLSLRVSRLPAPPPHRLRLKPELKGSGFTERIYR
jgi:hypothetical protein